MEIGLLFFFCLYRYQEIRLTDVPQILMATSSRHFLLPVLPRLHLCSLFLLIFLSHFPLPSPLHPPTPSPLPVSPVLDVFSAQQRRQFPYRITTRIRWPGFDSPSKPLHGKMKMYSCVLAQAHSHRCEQSLPPENVVRLQYAVVVDKPTAVFFFFWIAPLENGTEFVVIFMLEIKRKTGSNHNTTKSPTKVKPSGTAMNEILITAHFLHPMLFVWNHTFLSVLLRSLISSNWSVFSEQATAALRGTVMLLTCVHCLLNVLLPLYRAPCARWLVLIS